MRKSQKKDTRGGRYKIECKYAPEVLVPFEAIERSYYETASPWTEDLFITMDRKLCKPTFVCTWGEVNDDAMDCFCMDHFGMKFKLMRSLWFDRLKVRYDLKTWHFIKLDIVDEL